MGRRRSPAQKAQLQAVHARLHHSQENGLPEPPVPPPPPPEVPLPKKPRAWRRSAERPEIQQRAKDKSRLDIIQGKLHNAQRRENRARKKKEMLEERLMEGEAKMDETMVELAEARSLNDELQDALTNAWTREEEARGVAHQATLCELQATNRARTLQAHVLALEHHASEQAAIMRRSTRDEWWKAAHKMREVKEKSICQVREMEEHCAAVLHTVEQRHTDELCQVREQCAMYLATRTADLEGRATSLLSTIREQALADVRAAEEWAWELVRTAEERAAENLDAVRAQATGIIRAAKDEASQWFNNIKAHVDERVRATEATTRMLIQVIEHDAEERSAALVQVARDEAAAEMRVARERADEDIRHAREAADARVHAAQQEARTIWSHAMSIIADKEKSFAERASYLEFQSQQLFALVDLVQAAAAEQVEMAEAEKDAAVEHMEKMVSHLTTALEEVEGYLAEARTTVLTLHHENTTTHAHLDEVLADSRALKEQVLSYRKRNDVLRKRVERFPQIQDRAVGKAVDAAAAAIRANQKLRMKEKGIVPDSIRTLVRDLLALGVKVNQVQDVISTVAQAGGLVVEGTVSSRSIRRFSGEGYLAFAMQIVEEIAAAESITLSGDGTSHKKIQTEAHQLELNNGETHTHRILGISTAADHTSETQMHALEDFVAFAYNVHNNSPHGANNPADPRTLFAKTCGIMSDHAEDQKKRARLVLEKKMEAIWEIEGEKALGQMSLPEFLPVLAEETATAVQRAGGTEAWDRLTAEEQMKVDSGIWKAVIRRVGQAAYNALPEDERVVAELFIHGGCCMHKELNAMKGGYTRLMTYWDSISAIPPLLLMNKDNDDAARAGGKARAQAEEKSTGGAIKLTDLMGAAFRHKDDKRGHQDQYRYYHEERTGESITYPGTCATRFGSNGDAATVTLEHYELFRDYLQQVEYQKSEGLNHMEKNIEAALDDDPTLTELCVLSLYSQAISHPYMRAVRRPTSTRLNHLDLTPLHDELKAHMERIIADPDLLLGNQASHLTGALNGDKWDSPGGFVAVQTFAAGPRVPHLRGALVAFFEGALETWERFAAEFAPGGTVAQLSEIQRHLCFMPATNDANEGALGQYRVLMRQAPNMSLYGYNARITYKQNDTKTYIANLDGATLKYLRKLQRHIDGCQLERKRKRGIAETNRAMAAKRRRQREVAAEKKATRRAMLRNLTPILDPSILKTTNYTVPMLRLQVWWHREWVDTGPRGEKMMPLMSAIGTKDKMLAALIEAVERYNNSRELQQRAKEGMDKYDRNIRAGRIWEEDEDEGEEED